MGTTAINYNSYESVTLYFQLPPRDHVYERRVANFHETGDEGEIR